jgi:hypothetical protein
MLLVCLTSPLYIHIYSLTERRVVCNVCYIRLDIPLLTRSMHANCQHYLSPGPPSNATYLHFHLSK